MKLNEISGANADSLQQVQDYEYGDLDISDEGLTSLNGCPETLIGDDDDYPLFDCSVNHITSLEGCPEVPNGTIDCSHNMLKSLKYLPSTDGVGDYQLIADHNKLTSLEGCPKRIDGYFGVDNNNLTTMKYGPEEVNGGCNLDYNKLSSFEYFPKSINGDLEIAGNKFTSFKDIDKHIEFIDGRIEAEHMNITSGYSDLFGIDNIDGILIDDNEIEEIVNKYLPTKDLINFQDEMIKAGYESYL